MDINNKPVIAITSTMAEKIFVQMHSSYFNNLLALDCIPVYIPCIGGEEQAKEFIDRSLFDGILFSGGDDIDPKYFGEELTADNVEIVPERDEFELALTKFALEKHIPMLGICRGAQVINVAMGGTLYQDIPNHRQSEKAEIPTRTAKVIAETFLSELFGTESIETNSHHHQAIKALAPGLKLSAVAEDGICEAAEKIDDEDFILAIQWHPERLFNTVDSSTKIFREFVKASKKFGAEK